MFNVVEVDDRGQVLAQAHPYSRAIARHIVCAARLLTSPRSRSRPKKRPRRLPCAVHRCVSQRYGET